MSGPFLCPDCPDREACMQGAPCEAVRAVAADVVNHPPHYTSHPSGVECITIAEHMCFNLGNAIKYIWRADEKGNALEDLEKARWYVDREIARRTLATSPPTPTPPN